MPKPAPGRRMDVPFSIFRPWRTVRVNRKWQLSLSSQSLRRRFFATSTYLCFLRLLLQLFLRVLSRRGDERHFFLFNNNRRWFILCVVSPNNKGVVLVESPSRLNQNFAHMSRVGSCSANYRERQQPLQYGRRTVASYHPPVRRPTIDQDQVFYFRPCLLFES